MIKEVTTKLLEKILEELKTPENMTKMQIVVMDPLISYACHKMYPYFMMIIIVVLKHLYLYINIIIIYMNQFVIRIIIEILCINL